MGKRSAQPVRVAMVAASAILIWVQMGTLAFATFNSTIASPPSMSITAGTLSAPTGLSAATVNCTALTSTQVKLTWTATSSTWADGYEIFRSTTNGGPYTSKGTVSGRTTTTWTDTTTAFSTTYYYVVQATKNSWRSVNSTQVAFTTPSTLCV